MTIQKLENQLFISSVIETYTLYKFNQYLLTSCTQPPHLCIHHSNQKLHVHRNIITMLTSSCLHNNVKFLQLDMVDATLCVMLLHYFDKKWPQTSKGPFNISTNGFASLNFCEKFLHTFHMKICNSFMGGTTMQLYLTNEGGSI